MPTPAEPVSVDVRSRDEFSAESRQAFTRLQDAVRRVLAVTSVEAQRPTDLARALDLDYALAWQIHTLASQSEADVSARAVPKAGAMERFLKAAETVVPTATAVSLREAYAGFEATVEHLAGDRDTFDAIVTLQRPQDASGLRRIRRAAYKANTAVWGVMCRCGISSFIMHEGPNGTTDALGLRGRVGFQRLYPGAMASIGASSRFFSTSSPTDGGRPQLRVSRCELIEPACTKPLPKLVQSVDQEGIERDQLKIEGMGKLAESSFFWRNYATDLPGDMSRPPHMTGTTCVLPTELVLLDLLIPRRWLKNPSARVWTTPETTRGSTPDPDGPFHLPFEGGAKHLGSSIGSLHTPAVPTYVELVRSELKRVGWQDEVFEIYRCEVHYPILHTTTQLCVDDPGA